MNAASLASGWAEALCDPGYGMFPERVTPERVERLKQMLGPAGLEGARTGKGAGRSRRAEIRTDEILWLEDAGDGAAAGDWLRLMDEVRSHLREELRLPLSHFEGHLARYQPGGFYKPHLDQHAGSRDRQVSVVLYLNADWDEAHGGQLRIFTSPELGAEGPSVLVEPRAGTVVVFRSGDFWHEVLPCRRERWSLTGWFRLAGLED